VIRTVAPAAAAARISAPNQPGRHDECASIHFSELKGHSRGGDLEMDGFIVECQNEIESGEQ